MEFEGEYLDDERYGEGKEYDNKGKLTFEGEYIYNYKIRGKEYNNGKLEYEGEYLFDRKFNGKGYDNKGKIIYELKNGNGKVKEYYKNQLVFEGEYLNGKINCGVRYNINTKRKELEIDINTKRKELEIEKKTNLGKEYDINGKLIFTGKYLNGKRHGFGTEYHSNGIKYEGKYYYGKKHGEGKEYDLFGDLIFQGEYLNGVKHGEGKEYTFSRKLVFEGEYLNGKKWKGKIKEYQLWNSGNPIFEGEIVDGQRNGKGKEYDNVGRLIFEGEYKNGKKLKGKELNNI